MARATTILLIMMISSIALMTNISTANAQTNAANTGVPGPLPAGVTPQVTINVVAHLSFRPNPVGVGQTILVNMWVSPALHASRHHTGYKVTFTKPDGTTDTVTLDSYPADATGWFEYVVDKVGNWKVRFDFLGSYFATGNVTGGFMESGQVTLPSTYYTPATSGDRTLVVQDAAVWSWPASPLPTDYWTRPVHVENREWWTILGAFPSTGWNGEGLAAWDQLYPDTNPHWGSNLKFVPWVQGPNSAHIAWKYKGSLSGLIGGQAGTYGSSSSPGSPTIIYAGRAYQTYNKPGINTTAPTYWKCYDIRTGEVFWEYPVTTISAGGFFFGPSTIGLAPNLIEYTSPTQSEVTGAEAAGTWSVSLIYIGSGSLYKWDPWTGAMTANISISPLTSATFYQNPNKRNEEPLCLSIQDLGASAGTNRYRLINWTTRGTSTNFASRIKSNTTYARSSLPSLIDWNIRLGANVGLITTAGVWTGQTIEGVDLMTGQSLWNITVADEPAYSPVCSIVDHGKVAILSSKGYYLAYDLRTGALAWKGEQMNYPWASAGFGAYSAMSAYGLLVREAMDGVYAYNWTNGKIEWKYEAPANPYESPYTGENGTSVYPFYSFSVGGWIADGKFYTWTFEHTESWPLTRGWGLHCINMTDGKGVWNITGCSTPNAIADGYLTASNNYDGYMYVFGKGQSKTTVEAPLTAITAGQSVVIQGSVLDQSLAQPNTPCVSKDSMKTQMDYLHMQLPIDGIWHNLTMTGVPVSIDALDPNQNWIHIGDATTDPYTGKFGYTWKTPTITGQYSIKATFLGDDSYGSSTAAAYTAIVEAQSGGETAPIITQVVDNSTIIYTVIAAAVAIIIALAIAVVLLRRK